MRLGIALFVLLAVSSTIAKVFLSGLGHNFDLESWALFSDLIHEGKNVYAETYRNPYGPIWAYLCAGAAYVQAHFFGSESLVGFHRLLALFLSLVDVAIAGLLARRYSLGIGALFLLNPVSLLITGFHTQFENLAVLLALVACLLLEGQEAPRLARYGLAMSVLGVSLVVKHILIFLPLWFLFRPGASRRQRALSLLPLAIFGASFLPFVQDERGLEGVIEHVLMYDSFHLDGFFPHLVQGFVPLKAIELAFARVPVFSGFKFVWFAAMMLTGFAVRGRSYPEQLLVYLVAVVAFSSAIADQYLAIPMAACAVHFRRWPIWWYAGVSTIYLASSQSNIGMLPSMAWYAQGARDLGLDRWHSVAALFVFLLLCLAAGRKPLAGKLRGPKQEHAAGKREPGDGYGSRNDLGE
jgi:hypothetical protein